DDTGDVACDHYHRYREDVAWMRRLGLRAYRFSTSWSRLVPAGRGRLNPAGLAFYDRLVDELMTAEIEPWCCLYHWDLPQALEEEGGWVARDMAHRFADYASLVGRRLGDRVRHFATFNEPNVVFLKGYAEGVFAPGIADKSSALKALHHLNLAHGLGVAALRDERAGLLLGNIHNLHPVAPGRDRAADIEAAALMDELWNRSFPDPQFLGTYSPRLATLLAPVMRAGDEAVIHQKLDYFAFNHYRPVRVVHDPAHPFGTGEIPPPAGAKITDMGWEIAPQALHQQLLEIKARYPALPVYITENGAAFADRVEEDGRIRDSSRIAYLSDYLRAVHEAMAAGVPVKGYFVWSLLDNFEWLQGYSKRFGLLHVDFATQIRRPKDSFDFYAELTRSGVLE
ncbi:MAG TPA: GH1 family beta-glucosidase, partial [Stellaceae bacterium]|nr:GH1 family beta-glucosidase [Stellaceae bacterium]